MESLDFLLKAYALCAAIHFIIWALAVVRYRFLSIKLGMIILGILCCAVWPCLVLVQALEFTEKDHNF